MYFLLFETVNRLSFWMELKWAILVIAVLVVSSLIQCWFFYSRIFKGFMSYFFVILLCIRLAGLCRNAKRVGLYGNYYLFLVIKPNSDHK
jgi:hypothetical protein